MKVSLIVEGCYPFVTGGVSTWCDQLIRGLRQHSFEVVAITGSSGQRPLLDLPENVLSLRTVALWDWVPPRWRSPRSIRRAFLDAYRPFLLAVLDPAVPQQAFTDGLRELFVLAQATDLALAQRSEEAVSLLAETWHEVFPDRRMSLRDAVEATEVVEHLLLPLSERVIEADVSHAASNGLPALMGLAAKWRYGTPLVMSEHGVYLRERYLSCRGAGYRWPVKTMLLSLIRRICVSAYAACDTIVPVNVYNQRWEVRNGADPDAISTSYNGVDAASFAPASGEPETPTIGWVGRIDPLKDLETLVRAFALVRETIPEAVLRLFGPVPEGGEWYERRIRALVDELGLTASVTFEGPVRPVARAYHASTVVALSSISEGLPYTVMEAMMCGRTTVSTAVGGVPEIVGDTGVVVPPRDPGALAKGCIGLLDDPERRACLAESARARAIERFCLERMLEAFDGVYEEVTRRHRNLLASRFQAAGPVPAAVGR
ncbi:MAG: GT4 family glycosyltransferase PelF [Actinomycetales bacterium]|nr:GT4 family glycosyltransferase PelF [Actinomycetales bacterium]